jgi:hypothetical protein
MTKGFTKTIKFEVFLNKTFLGWWTGLIAYSRLPGHNPFGFFPLELHKRSSLLWKIYKFELHKHITDVTGSVRSQMLGGTWCETGFHLDIWVAADGVRVKIS